MNDNNNEITNQIAPTKEFFKEIVQETGLSEEKIHQEFPTLDQPSNDDTIEPIKTATDQEKILAYDELAVKSLPRDWKARLSRLKHLEKELSNYSELKANFQTWTDAFSSQTAPQIQEQITHLEEKNIQTEQNLSTKIKNLELSLDQSIRENQSLLSNSQKELALLKSELNNWKGTWNNRELSSVKEEWDALHKRPALSLTEKQFYDDYARRTPLDLAESQKKELIEVNEKLQACQQENKDLWKTINDFLAKERVKRYVLAEPVSSSSQAQQAISELLAKTEREWNDYLENKEDNIATKNLKLSLVFQDEKKKIRAQEILAWIAEAQQSQDYQQLFSKWNGVMTDYNNENDFDGSLYLLKKYLEINEE